MGRRESEMAERVIGWGEGSHSTLVLVMFYGLPMCCPQDGLTRRPTVGVCVSLSLENKNSPTVNICIRCTKPNTSL